MSQKTIAVLFGGCSTEHSVSLQSAQAVLRAINREQYLPLAIGITREGAWRFFPGNPDRLPDGSWERDPGCVPCVLSPDRTCPGLLLLGKKQRFLPIDAAFPVLHGKNGEDGTLQGLLELAGIPIVGCGTLASALGMDKDRAHRLAALAGVPSPRGIVFERGEEFSVMERAAESLGWPLFVKPVRSGSSFGVSRASHPSELREAVEKAFLHDTEILLEEAVPGFEIGCAVVGNNKLVTGRVDEIELSAGFFDYEEKYTLKTSKLHCPARISPEKEEEAARAAKTVYRALGCRGFARVDLFLTPDGTILFNEVNTIPGFTSHSRFPSMMKAVGVSFDRLVNRLIALAFEDTSCECAKEEERQNAAPGNAPRQTEKRAPLPVQKSHSGENAEKSVQASGQKLEVTA